VGKHGEIATERGDASASVSSAVSAVPIEVTANPVRARSGAHWENPLPPNERGQPRRGELRALSVVLLFDGFSSASVFHFQHCGLEQTMIGEKRHDKPRNGSRRPAEVNSSDSEQRRRDAVDSNRSGKGEAKRLRVSQIPKVGENTPRQQQREQRGKSEHNHGRHSVKRADCSRVIKAHLSDNCLTDPPEKKRGARCSYRRQPVYRFHGFTDR
jgi:hypothetical protein